MICKSRKSKGIIRDNVTDFLTTAVVRLLLSIKRDSFRRYRGELNALGNVSKAMNAFIML